MRRAAWTCLVGFLAGAASVVVGGDERALRAELRRLEVEASRLARISGEVELLPEPPPAGLELAILPLEDIAGNRADYLPPSFAFRRDGVRQFGGVEEAAPRPIGTTEEILELVRATVDPGVWRTASLLVAGNALVVRAPAGSIRRTRELLERTLRPRLHRGVVVDFEVRAGRERRPLHALRLRGTLGSRSYVWQGAQRALRIDSDVEVTTNSSSADPVVDVAALGACLSVRAWPVEGSHDLMLELDLRSQEPAGLRRGATRQAVVLDLVSLARRSATPLLRVPPNRWVVASRSRSPAGELCTLRVRAVPFERGAER